MSGLNDSEGDSTERNAFRFLADAGSDGYGRALGLACADAESGPMTCSPTLLSLEKGRMRVTMNLRYPITANGQDILRVLKEKAAEYGLSVLWAEDSAPNYMDPKGIWVQFLTQACKRSWGPRRNPTPCPAALMRASCPVPCASAAACPGISPCWDCPRDTGNITSPMNPRASPIYGRPGKYTHTQYAD